MIDVASPSHQQIGEVDLPIAARIVQSRLVELVLGARVNAVGYQEFYHANALLLVLDQCCVKDRIVVILFVMYLLKHRWHIPLAATQRVEILLNLPLHTFDVTLLYGLKYHF